MLALALASQFSVAQQAAAPAESPSHITFKFGWDQGRPWTTYAITVAENGATHFSGTGDSEEYGESDTYQQDFIMSEVNRQKIFQLARDTNYFQGQFETRQKNIAQTGQKTLEYDGASLHNSTTYNYSPNQNVQQLTKLFQSIATTVGYGRKLAYQYRFDKLGMDAQLKDLIDTQSSGFALEIQAIEPILTKIANDPNLMHIARVEARQLLKSASGGPGGAAATAPNQP
jgi:hypothetical protein